MSDNTKTVELANGKSIVLHLREDGKVSQVDVFFQKDHQPDMHQYPQGISEEEAMRNHTSDSFSV